MDYIQFSFCMVEFNLIFMAYTCCPPLRWNPSFYPEGLEKSEEAKADRRVFSAG